MSDKIHHERRRLLGTAAGALAAASLGIIPFTGAQSSTPQGVPEVPPTTRRLNNTSLGTLKQIDAGLLNDRNAQAGPAEGPVVLLLHGWPYDIHSYVDVAPRLASAGHRAIVPYLRGYGTTRFLSGSTFRNGQQSALAIDTIALMDALKIKKAIVAGFDWAHGQPTSSRRSGPNAAGRSSR
jgi:pimeloyl-ACP methyl ester carboxylesterase